MPPFHTVKRLLWLVPSILSLLLLGACSESEPAVGKQNQPAVAVEEKQVIALVMKTLTNPFFIEMERVIKDYQPAGVEAVVN